MIKIAINLLPVEFRTQELKTHKFYKIQSIGVAVVMVMFFLASLTVALRVLQSKNISQIQNRLALAEGRVSKLKNTQASLLLLKNRITTIQNYLGISSQQTQMYKLIADLIPAEITLNSLSVDKSGNVLILALVPDSTSLDTLVNNLISSDNNKNKISQVSLDNISRGRDGVFRLSFKVKPK